MIQSFRQRFATVIALICLLSGMTLTMSARTSLLKDYTPNGESFTRSTAINFQKQTFKAVLDLSTCKSSTQHENVLSIGEDLQGANGWGGVYVIHLF